MRKSAVLDLAAVTLSRVGGYHHNFRNTSYFHRSPEAHGLRLQQIQV